MRNFCKFKKIQVSDLNLHHSHVHAWRCVHAMPHDRMQHNTTLPRGRSCSAYAARLIMSTLKKNFCQLYFSSKNCGMRNRYASYAAQKIKSILQLMADISAANLWWYWPLPVKFSCCVAFCNMLQLAEAMLKSHCIDIFTIFGKAALCCILLCDIV